jgi:DcuC family C4-dicarboxylate transporter
MTEALGVLVITAAVVAVVCRVDVRLALTLAGLAMGALAWQTQEVFQAFVRTLVDEKFVVPICTAMGFAYTLRLTGCDQHLVQLLVKPVRRVRPLLVPGAVVVGFVVNLPVISQASTVVTIGPVLVPLMRAARLSAVTIGAALLLGASIGGELLNPGAPELRTVSKEAGVDAKECVERNVLPLLAHLGTAVGVFWLISARAEARTRRAEPEWEAKARVEAQWPDETSKEKEEPPFSVNPLKAAVPLLPLALLFLTGPPLDLFNVPPHWLAGANEADAVGSRLIGAAMLVGTVAAALTAPRKIGGVGRAFFDGAGYAYAHIISVIVAATCFAKGVEQTGLAQRLGDAVAAAPALLTPAAAGVPLLFAALCGSGMASTQGLFHFFVGPARAVGVHPASLGPLVSIGAAAGRTMSPVAAVTHMSASLSGADGVALARRVALPLLAGMIVIVLLHLLLPAG